MISLGFMGCHFSSDLLSKPVVEVSVHKDFSTPPPQPYSYMVRVRISDRDHVCLQQFCDGNNLNYDDATIIADLISKFLSHCQVTACMCADFNDWFYNIYMAA